MLEGITLEHGGKVFKVTGITMALVVIIACLVAYIVWFLSVDTRRQHEAIAKILEEQGRVAAESNKRQADATEEQNFMLFYATPEQLKKIRERVKVPERLREALR